jgi:stress response protein YsnF
VNGDTPKASSEPVVPGAGDRGVSDDSHATRRAERPETLDDTAMTRSEERLVASTEVYESGRARLRKYVVTEDVQITVQVRREELRIEREPITGAGQVLVEDPDVFGTLEEFGGPDGGVIFEVTLHEERPLITTEIVAVERVRVSKLVQTEQHIASGQIRKEVIQTDLPGQPPATLD